MKGVFKYEENKKIFACMLCLIMLYTNSAMVFASDTMDNHNHDDDITCLYGPSETTFADIEPINTNGCQIYGADYYGYTSNNYLNGYKFFLYS